MLKIRILIAIILIAIVQIGAQTKSVQILVINDMHANLDNIPKFGGIIDSLKNIYPNMLIFSSGDNRTGDPYNDMYPETSRPMIDLMNELGFNISAIGNHEFDGNTDGFKKNYDRAKFEFISANVKPADSLGFKFEPYKILNVNDIKIGVLGVLQLSSRGIPDSHPDNIHGITFLQVEPTIEKYAEVLRNQCDIEILLSHIGYDDDKIMAQKFPMFDAIFGGHSHTLLKSNTMENGVLITQSRNKVKNCTLVKFEVENGKVVNKTSEIIDIVNFSTESDKIKKMTEQYKDNPDFAKVVTRFEKPVNGYQQLGCMMADGQRYTTNSQVAIQNGGGIRYDTHPAGNFIVSDGLKLDPFGNNVWVFDVKGADIANIIRDCYTIDELQIPEVSGVKYEMIIDKNDNSNVKSIKVTLENGKAIKKRKKYTVAINSYVVSILNMTQKYKGREIDKTTYECMMEYLQTQDSVDYSEVERRNVKF